MGKDKSWKLESTLKIDDGQLKTPVHDKMCLWVDKNIEKIMEEIIIPLFPQGISNLILKWEEPIRGHNGYVIGIPDFSFFFTDKETDIKYGGYIEVKPSILSIGETMRQIKLYKSNYYDLKALYVRLEYPRRIPFTDFASGVNDSFIIIVTRTLEFKELFERQGIDYFILEDDML